MTPGEAASMNPGGAVTGGDAGVRGLVAACVAEVLEILLSMNPGEEVTGWEVVGKLLSMIRDGAVKIGGGAGVRELVAASVADALVTLLVAAREEKAQREKAQREAKFVARQAKLLAAIQAVGPSRAEELRETLRSKVAARCGRSAPRRSPDSGDSESIASDSSFAAGA